VTKRSDSQLCRGRATRKKKKKNMVPRLPFVTAGGKKKTAGTTSQEGPRSGGRGEWDERGGVCGKSDRYNPRRGGAENPSLGLPR